MSILRMNKSKTKYCVLHNGMITWNSSADIFKVNVSFSMFKSKVRDFYLEKYWCWALLWLHFFLKFMQLRFFKCNCVWFWVFCCEVSNYFFICYNQDNSMEFSSWRNTNQRILLDIQKQDTKFLSRKILVNIVGVRHFDFFSDMHFYCQM